MLVLTALVLGPSVSTLSMSEYFRRKDEWGYIARNITFLQPRYVLPEVFETNPYPRSVCGSIWTLPFEIGCYLGVAVLGAVGLLKRWRSSLFILAYAVGYTAFRGDWAAAPPFWAETSLPFVIGGWLYLARERVPLSWIIGVGGAILTYLSWRTPVVREILTMTVVYSAFLFASISSERLHRFGRFGDLSYGIYIYGFPVEQTVAYAMPGIGPVTLAVVTFYSTLPIAAASWHFVEKPALDRRHVIGRRLASLGLQRRA